MFQNLKLQPIRISGKVSPVSEPAKKHVVQIQTVSILNGAMTVNVLTAMKPIHKELYLFFFVVTSIFAVSIFGTFEKQQAIKLNALISMNVLQI